MSAQNEDFRSTPIVTIDYYDNAKHEGRYVPRDVLPFKLEDSAGIRFDMDGTQCEICGDLGGHAVYRRDRSRSQLRAMDWEDFVLAYERGHITITN